MGFFCTLASGSSGNAAVYVDGRARVLIDAGTNTRFLVSCLRTLGLTPDMLTHVLVTHSHSDHISALSVLLKHTRALVVCTDETAARLTLPAGARVETIEPGAAFELADCPVRAFATPHDAQGSCGYVLGRGAQSAAVCTDLGVMTQEIADALRGTPTVLLESNHDVQMLKCGPYPYYLKTRILSDHGHLSNDACARGARWLAQTGTRRLLLAHLSAENNTRALAYETTRAALAAAGAEGVETEVAPRSGLGRPVLF